MRLRARAASLCAAALLVAALVPAAAQAQEPLAPFDQPAGLVDSDGDGVFDSVDNCVADANASQANLDGDTLGDACDTDDDGDTRPDASDNCPQVPNPHQSDVDQDGIGDHCDVLETNDGFAGGGGLLTGGAVVSFALHSRDGRLRGSGRLVDDGHTVELLDLTGMHSNGSWALAVGTASVDGGAPAEYRLELVDDNDWVVLEVAGLRWVGPLYAGNIVVR